LDFNKKKDEDDREKQGKVATNNVPDNFALAFERGEDSTLIRQNRKFIIEQFVEEKFYRTDD
jgi:hypothetical protein